MKELRAGEQELEKQRSENEQSGTSSGMPAAGWYQAVGDFQSGKNYVRSELLENFEGFWFYRIISLSSQAPNFHHFPVARILW